MKLASRARSLFACLVIAHGVEEQAKPVPDAGVRIRARPEAVERVLAAARDLLAATAQP